MIDLNNIKDFSTPPPAGYTVFGSAEEFNALSETYKDQIIFLNKVAEKYIYEFIENARLLTGGGWDPFAKGNFKTIEKFEHAVCNLDNNQLLKKWVFNRGIPFGTWVFVLFDGGNTQPLHITWKLFIKYANDIFRTGDVMVFDQTLNWCLFNYHEGQLFFGKDKIYDAEEDEQKMHELNERKKKFPHFRHPYL